MRRTVVAAAGLVAALSACGGWAKQSDVELVAGSADAAVIAGTARIIGHESIVIDGERTTVPLNGVTDFQAGTAAMKIDLASLGLPVKGVVESRVVDQVMYMKLGDLLRGENPPAGFRGKDWIKLDLHQISAGSSDASGNPGNLLGTLRGAAHVKRVGTEKIHGVETTHFKANVDTRAAVGKIKDRKLRKLAEKGMAILGDSLPVDVWIDDDGLTRRMQLKYSVKGTSVDEVVDFVDFGIDAFIVAPPKSATIDFKELLSRSGGDLGST